MQPCPVPDIDRALSPYIKTREETLKVRRTLSKYLTASFRPVNAATQNQHLNHGNPSSQTAVGTNPPGLKGRRSTYLEAIRNHKAAQTRLERLQTAMEELQQRHTFETPIDDSPREESEMVQSYIALLRQRRRFAELEVVQEYLEKLLNVNPIEGITDPRELVKNSIGEQPNLPAERLESLSNGENSDSSLLKLKKEVLDARSSMDRAKAARKELHSAARVEPGLAVQVHALSLAREEMIEWVQGELGKMEEESGFIEDASPVKRPVANPSDLDLTSSEARIRDCYIRYTTSRLATIEGHGSFQQPPATHAAQTDNSDQGPETITQNAANSRPQVSAASLLPYLPHLARTHTNEQLMLLQSVYLKSQISSADVEASESLTRLADESHLLPSGSRGIESWSKAVVELDVSNVEAVQERLQNSRYELNNVTTIVDLCSLQSKVLDSN